MIALPYTLELLDPLLATAFGGGDPNSKRSLDYIPGSMIRGALIEAYLRREDKTQLTIDDRDTIDDRNAEAAANTATDTVGSDEYRRFLGSGVYYLNAYPEVKINNIAQRLLPTPQGWQQIKPVVGMQVESSGGFTLHPDDVYDPLVLAWPDLKRTLPRELTWRRAGDESSFCWHDAESVYLHTVERILLDHTTRDRSKGRATRAKGNLFRYDALAAGQRFAGVILTHDEADAHFLQELLAGARLALGGARRAGYGRVTVRVGAPIAFWEGETEPLEDAPQPGDWLVLSAFSAWVLEDDAGQPLANLRAESLAHLLEVDASALEALPAATRRRMTVVGGFNRTAGMQQPQRQVIAAGSTFAFRVRAPLPLDRLQQLQEEGFGLRRLDGFGRVALNWQSAARYQQHQEAAQPLAVAVPHLPAALRAFGQQIGERILRQELEEALLAAVRARPVRLLAARKSQLARVRAVIREALRQLPPANAAAAAVEELATLGQTTVEPVREFLAALKTPAREQLARTRLREGAQETRLLYWLQETISAIGAGRPRAFPALAPVTVGDLTVAPPPAWQIEYSLRLIDGVLAQAAKSAQEG